MLLRLTEEEKDVAEILLIQSAKQGGMWATHGLAAIKSKNAIPILKEQLNGSPSVLRVRIADALEEIEQNGKYVPILIEELLKDSVPYDKLEAAMILKKYPSEDVLDALYKGMLDEDYLVRYHSSESILYIYGFKPDIVQQDEIFSEICREKNREDTNEENYSLATKLMKKLVSNREYKPYL